MSTPIISTPSTRMQFTESSVAVPLSPLESAIQGFINADALLGQGYRSEQPTSRRPPVSRRACQFLRRRPLTRQLRSDQRVSVPPDSQVTEVERSELLRALSGAGLLVYASSSSSPPSSRSGDVDTANSTTTSIEPLPVVVTSGPCPSGSRTSARWTRNATACTHCRAAKKRVSNPTQRV